VGVVPSAHSLAVMVLIKLFALVVIFSVLALNGSALQTVSLSGGGTRSVTIPLLPGSTSNVAVESALPCPATGSPMGAFCAQYTLVVPASNPNVGSFSAGKIAFSPPASGSVLYSVEADATKPMSGGATICSMPSYQLAYKSVLSPDEQRNLTCPKGQVIVSWHVRVQGTGDTLPLADSSQEEYVSPNFASVFLFARDTPGPACYPFLAAG
jgi:hypothetical protein